MRHATEYLLDACKNQTAAYRGCIHRENDVFHPNDAGQIAVTVFEGIEADENVIYPIVAADRSGVPASPMGAVCQHRRCEG